MPRSVPIPLRTGWWLATGALLGLMTFTLLFGGRYDDDPNLYSPDGRTMTLVYWTPRTPWWDWGAAGAGAVVVTVVALSVQWLLGRRQRQK